MSNVKAWEAWYDRNKIKTVTTISVADRLLALIPLYLLVVCAIGVHYL